MQFLVISDIHGRPRDMAWLADRGAIHYLTLGDLCTKPFLSGSELHGHLFEQGGMKNVVSKLRDFSGAGFLALGFSAGGTALWRAVSEGLQLKTLACVSSTRLRYENNRLAIPTHTFWGELDPHRPSGEWCRSVPSNSTVYKGAEHNFYDEVDGVIASTYRSDILVALTS